MGVGERPMGIPRRSVARIGYPATGSTREDNINGWRGTGPAGTQGAVVAQKVAPPDPIPEIQPVAPVAVANPAWTPGHWEWRGTWVWVAGHYVAASNPQAVWVQGEWMLWPTAVGDGTRSLGNAIARNSPRCCPARNSASP